MKVKTYFWYDRVYSSLRYQFELVVRRRTNGFRIGNAGDIYVKDLIKYKYGLPAYNMEGRGRLLLVGSISHKIQEGDVVCGIGTKFLEIPKTISRNVTILGLRGPITYDVMKKIDEKDTPFLALAMQLSCPIWSNDNHFKQQRVIEVYTTREIVDLVEMGSWDEEDI